MKLFIITLATIISTLAHAGTCRVYLFSENGRACDIGSDLGHDNYYAMNLYIPAGGNRTQPLYAPRGNPSTNPQLFYYEPYANNPKACLEKAHEYMVQKCFPTSGLIRGERAQAVFVDSGRGIIRSSLTVSGPTVIQVRDGNNWVDFVPFSTIHPNR